MSKVDQAVSAVRHATGWSGHLRRRAAWWSVVLLIGITLVVLGGGPILRAIATFLIVEDRLEPAAAIVVMGGHLPFRAMEAAELYRAGWAPQVILTRGTQREEQQALRALNVPISQEWELNREVLLRLGVPPSAILVLEGEAEGTLEELRIIANALRPDGALVILVTSKVHTRRVRLTWRYVAGGRSRGIIRSARQDPFDPNGWWRERRFALAVVRESLGLMNHLAGFPVAARATQRN